MKSNYYSQEESKDWELLQQFNNKLKLEDMGRTPNKHYYDASGYTNCNQYTEIELKNRKGRFVNGVLEFKTKNNNTYTATTIYIEPQHYSRMIDDYRFEGKLPLYVNFLGDGNVLIWNLSTLKNKPEWKYVTHIWDEGKKIYKDEWRILLDINEAFIYDSEYKLIQKPAA